MPGIYGMPIWSPAARHSSAPECLSAAIFECPKPGRSLPWVAAFVQRLRELGWIASPNIAIEYRWAEVRPERYAEISAEFVRLKIDVIVIAGTAPVSTANQPTSILPIPFPAGGAPVPTRTTFT